MAIKKKYLKSKPICKVSFNLPKDAAKDASKVFLVGEFNEWTLDSTPMKKLKTGAFTVTVDLEVGQDYQFRYLIDGSTWENDWEADGYEYSPFGDCENSIVSV